VFTCALFVSVLLYGSLLLLLFPLGHARIYRMVRWWADWMLALLKRLCGLGFTVEGLERLPCQNTVVLMKHASTWETLAQIKIFPPQTWVMKRELLWAPILGWVLLLLKPIAIDRRGGRAAVQHVIAEGCRRLDEGLWVIIFPEGTRVPAGQTRRYGLSGVLLASAAGRPIVPVAHNAGEFWPRRGLLKKRGTIHVVIGTPIATAGRDPREVNAEVQRFIEGTLQELASGRPAARHQIAAT
jgi:1-acyl-sn-glycerol-3-phosphate acyltransferase